MGVSSIVVVSLFSLSRDSLPLRFTLDDDHGDVEATVVVLCKINDVQARIDFVVSHGGFGCNGVCGSFCRIFISSV